MNSEIELHTDFETFSEDHTQCTDHYNYNQWLYKFGDIKVSVVCHMFERKIIIYGDAYAPFELAILDPIDFGIIGDPIGYLTENKVNRILHKIDRAVKMKQAINEDFVERLGGC